MREKLSAVVKLFSSVPRLIHLHLAIIKNNKYIFCSKLRCLRSKTFNTKQSLMILFFSCLSLMACDRSSKNKGIDEMKDIKSRPYNKQEKRPLVKSLISFNYVENKHQRNPFVLASHGNASERYSSHLYLNEFVSSALKFVGFLTSSSHRWALIKDPSGKINPVKLGDYIGKDKIKVIKMRQGTLICNKQILSNGRLKKKIIKLPLNSRNRS